jgi:GNAT superfamily N-acetyltransferase
MEFRRVDPRDERQFDAWFDILHRAELERDHGRDEGWLPQEWRARALDETEPNYHQLFTLSGPDGAVAIGALEVTREENLAWIRADLFVDPRQLRQGYGSTMLAYLEASARELGRTSVLFWVVEDAPERGHGSSRGFAPRHGYEVVEENIIREMTWPRPHGELDHLQSTWAPKARDYEILSWRGGAASELALGLAHLKGLMPVEVPDSGFGAEVEVWDEHRFRLYEERANAMGRDLLMAAARHRESGEVVGLSELTVSRERPETAYQWDTLVRRDHRGHSLGALLKIATMRLLQEGSYETKKIMTSNNTLNTAMIAVNDSLGAYPTGGVVVWRKKLTN